MNEHEAFVQQAQRVFGNSEIVSNHTYESQKAALFGYLKEQNAHHDALTRWKLACEFVQEMQATHRFRPPYSDWLNRIQQVDLKDLLARLHASGQALDYQSTDPSTWPGSEIPF